MAERQLLLDSPKAQNVRVLLFSLFLVVVVSLSGCRNKYGTTPVSGTVELDGKALPDIFVIFNPVEGGRANSTAKTNENGEFELVYTHDSAGAIPGSYKVLFSQIKKVNDLEVEMLPSRYNTESTKVVEVTKSGNNKFDFELTSDRP